MESFAGVGNPSSLRPLQAGKRVVDFGSGAGFDCFVAALAVGGSGGERNARAYEVAAHVFLARKPLIEQEDER